VLSAVDLATGTERWSVATHPLFGVRKGFFGAATSPLVADGRVFINVGGRDAGVVAFDAGSGSTVWTASDDEASYSSAVIAELGGRRRVLFFTRAGLLAADPASGAVDFEFPWTSRSRSSVNAATPLLVGDDRILLTASYQTGAVLLRVDGGNVEPLWQSDDVLSAHYATPIHYGRHLYGYHGRQEYGPSLRCVELDSGRVQWSIERFGAGSLTLVGDRLLILREDGRLILAAATPDAFTPLAETTLLSPVVRAYPAYSDGVLFARNETEMIAVRLR